MSVRLSKRVSLVKASPRVLSSVTPYRARVEDFTLDGPLAQYRNSQAGAFISAVANGWANGGTYGASAARYVVGGESNTVTLVKGASRAERTAAAIEFVAGKKIDAYVGVGFWADDNGRIVLDSVQAWHTLEVALTVAHIRGERAIYDSREDVVIPVTS